MQEVGAREDEVFGCVKEDMHEVKMKCLDVVKEDMQEVGAREDEVFGCGEGGAREDEVFGCGEGGHAGGRSEGR